MYSRRMRNVIRIMCWDILNSGFRLFGRIRIVLWTIRPNKNTNTNSVGRSAFWRCTCCSDIYHLFKFVWMFVWRVSMLLSHDPLPFIRLIVSQNQAVWARASGTDWVKSSVDAINCTIRIRSDDTIRLNMHTLFGPLFGTEANTKRIFGTSLILWFVFFCFVGWGVMGRGGWRRREEEAQESCGEKSWISVPRTLDAWRGLKLKIRKRNGRFSQIFYNMYCTFIDVYAKPPTTFRPVPPLPYRVFNSTTYNISTLNQDNNRKPWLRIAFEGPTQDEVVSCYSITI